MKNFFIAMGVSARGFLLCEVADFVEISVIDHIVVGTDGSVSAREIFKEAGDIFFTPHGYDTGE